MIDEVCESDPVAVIVDELVEVAVGVADSVATAVVDDVNEDVPLPVAVAEAELDDVAVADGGTVQEAAPGPDTRPAAHGEHCELPGGLYELALQRKQLALDVALKVPAAHCAQAVPPTEKKPGKHMEHVEDTVPPAVRLPVPGGHAVQDGVPVEVA